MAEQDTKQHMPGVREGETHSTNMDHVSPNNEFTQEKTDITLNIQHSDGKIFKKDSASSSASTKRHAENNNSDEGMEQGDIKNCDSGEEKRAPLKEPSASSNEANLLTAEDNSTLTESHGDPNRATPRNERLTAIEDHTGDEKAPKTTTPPTVDDREDKAEGVNAKVNEEVTGTDRTDTEAGEEEDHTERKKAPKTTSPPTVDDGEYEQTDGPSAIVDEETTGIDDADNEANEDCDSGEEKMTPLKEPSASSNEANLLTAEDNSTLTESHGDPNRATPRNERLTAIEDHTGDEKAPKTTTPPTVDDREDKAEGVNAKVNEEVTGTDRTDTEAGEEEDHTERKKAPKTTSPPTVDDGEYEQTDGPSAIVDEETTGIDDADNEANEDCDSGEEKMTPLKEPSASSNEANLLTAEDNSTLTESHGDPNRATPRNERLTAIGEDHTGDEKAPKTTTPPTVDDREDKAEGVNAKVNEEVTGTDRTDTEAGEEEDHTERKKAPKTTSPPTVDDGEYEQTDGPSATVDEETTGIDDADNEDNEDAGNDPDIQKSTTPPQISLPCKEEEKYKCRSDIENIGPVTQQTTEPALPVVAGSLGGSKRWLLAVGIAGMVIAVLAKYFFSPESPPQKDDMQQINIFLKQMDKLNTRFPNQRVELWNRSKIHLLRHLQTAQPTEPVSLILTAGVRAEQTLHCLAQGLASAFSSAHNASVLHIDGASKASQDSDQVKLDIDSKLQGAFEGDKPVAVIHRFEELPPGSTLIFYRYCDHENAAYKKTFLIFTVLLGEEEEIPVNSRLSTVEEMVDDHLQKKFLSHGHPVSFDRMDLDKYGGLWSRISHLILPVTAEERMEHEGCLGI
uniref:torsin-1A-interacting protein 2-like isoform X2 n=1 Tax=Scatophagus argus TaxID=75038 RepID=UPI001ED8307A|nr:torsin-1A-interacting protein 2-like isoform X2 [Scatophagus argus]